MKTKVEDLKTHPNSLSKASYAKWMAPDSPVRDGVTFPFFHDLQIGFILTPLSCLRSCHAGARARRQIHCLSDGGLYRK